MATQSSSLPSPLPVRMTVFSECEQYTSTGNVTHLTATFSQVPGSQAWVERRVTLRSRRTSAAVASPITLSARTTRTRLCPSSSRTLATSMPASTSELSSATRTFLTLCAVPGPRHPRRFCAGTRDPNHPPWSISACGRNKCRNARSSPSSVFHAEALSWQTANIQIVAGVISLLNDYRLSQGKHALGFINPWLYGDGRTGLNDITSGTNPGCDTPGFSAIEGWDPVCPPTDWLSSDSVLTCDVLRR
jgi:hypothetical protein